MTCFAMIECTPKTDKHPESLKPFGLRRVFDKGFGDRYYSGLPAYHYQHLWPEWKKEIWYTIGDWNDEEAPEWIEYYNYPYIVWPNFYRYFGSPYYSRDHKQKQVQHSTK